MLKYSGDDRISAIDALSHPWLAGSAIVFGGSDDADADTDALQADLRRRKQEVVDKKHAEKLQAAQARDAARR